MRKPADFLRTDREFTTHCVGATLALASPARKHDEDGPGQWRQRRFPFVVVGARGSPTPVRERHLHRAWYDFPLDPGTYCERCAETKCAAMDFAEKHGARLRQLFEDEVEAMRARVAAEPKPKRRPSLRGLSDADMEDLLLLHEAGYTLKQLSQEFD